MRAIVISALALMGCTASHDTGGGDGSMVQTYKGVETLLLDGDLVGFRVAMTGARGPEDVERYARCAAAQYTLIRLMIFLRD